MAKFIAIPVGQGDAFYLERKDVSILVDGGRGVAGFPGNFNIHTGRDHANILVCTHNDADHANGILGFLKGGLGCDEIWLPGIWSSKLYEILGSFDDVYNKLFWEVKDLLDSRSDDALLDIKTLEDYSDRLDDLNSNQDDYQRPEPINSSSGWTKTCVSKIEKAEPWERWSSADPWPFFHCVKEVNLPGAGRHLWWSAIVAAHQIREIAIEAFHRGVKVRWFEYNTNNPGGGKPNILVPVNSREQKDFLSFSGTLLNCLALTVSNKESLVFLSPSSEQSPGVLFTADSDLNSVKLISTHLRGALVTAPHHGSEANRNAYTVVNTAAEDYSQKLRWVRSDGRYRNRPGATYLGIPSGQRLCTICRHKSGKLSKKQRLHFYEREGTWVRKRTNHCSCQKA